MVSSRITYVDDAGDLGPTVFVSYAHEDKPFAHSLAGALGERSCSVWVDEFELRAGDSLTERVAGALTSADFVITLISSASVSSQWCRRELQMALSTGLASGRTIVLPVRLGSVTMPPSLTDLVYVPAEPDGADEAADRLVRDIKSHAAEVEGKREADTTEREWEFALQPAHELDSVLGDLEQEMDYLWTVGASRKGKTTYEQAFVRWQTVVDKWHGGSRLPHVMHELAWRLEGLLEVAVHHEQTYRRNQGVVRRLNRIVGAGIIETREMLSITAKDPSLFAPSALADCSIPPREELFLMVGDDPRLFKLQELVVPQDSDDESPAGFK
jgi:hypothetical protein